MNPARRAQAALLLISPAQSVLLKQMNKKILDDILRVSRRIATYLPTVFLCGSKAPEISVADSSPHGRIVQTRSTTRYDIEAEEPEM
jgi:hypothetical protein